MVRWATAYFGCRSSAVVAENFHTILANGPRRTIIESEELGTETFNDKIRDTFNFRRRHGADNLDSDRRILALRRVVPAAKYRG